MPGFDGTGPLGYGPRTGGGFGYCSPVSGPAPYRGSYPWFGVGFSGTPDIDTYLGVSNVYLLVAIFAALLGGLWVVVRLGA